MLNIANSYYGLMHYTTLKILVEIHQPDVHKMDWELHELEK